MGGGLKEGCLETGERMKKKGQGNIISTGDKAFFCLCLFFLFLFTSVYTIYYLQSLFIIYYLQSLFMPLIPTYTHSRPWYT
jgi:hypothetical protein